MDLEGKGVLITGAAARVGRAIALELARCGARVAIHYHRSARSAGETVRELESLGSAAIALRADLSQHKAVSEMVGRAAAGLGRLDAIVNNASVFYRTPLEDLSDSHWDENLKVNLLAPWWVVQAALPHLRSAGQGAIVNIVDWAGFKPYTDYLPYVVSKAGLICLTKALAKELAPEITVNGVAPGPVLPPEHLSSESLERIARRVPLKRWGSPADVAAAVRFFIAGTDFATGSILCVDGGSLIA